MRDDPVKPPPFSRAQPPAPPAQRALSTDQALSGILREIDDKPYKAYKRLKGGYAFADFQLYLDHIQGDPFARPSRICAQLDLDGAGFPSWSWHTPIRRRALADYLIRAFQDAAGRLVPMAGASGRSGRIHIQATGPEVLSRTALVITPPTMECRFYLGLPGRGRSVMGGAAHTMLLRMVPELVRGCLHFHTDMERSLVRHLESVEDQTALREQLTAANLTAFIGNGACLPRCSGVDSQPMQNAVRFQSPTELEVGLDTLNSGRVFGMGIPDGVTLIVGGGYHGKSTLLDAIMLGVYDHKPGDGRERVVSRADAVKIRAEDGRRVVGVDIEAFVRDLPDGRSTRRFTSEDASGSTSQAANIMEALEVGCGLLLIDEDTSATNFMVRDRRMRSLIGNETIRPYIDHVRPLFKQRGVNTIMVVGGIGDYLDVADTVLLMDEFCPRAVTETAASIAKAIPSQREPGSGPADFGESRRLPDPASINGRRRDGREKIDAPDTHTIRFGDQRLDLSALEQIVDPAQTLTIGRALIYLRDQILNGNTCIAEALGLLGERLTEHGPDILNDGRDGNLAQVRGYEIAAALNRLRSLSLAPAPPPETTAKE